MLVNRRKTVSEYKIPIPKFFVKNVKATYWVSLLYEFNRERQTQKSFENKSMPKHSFKFEINDMDTAYTKIQENQRIINLQTIADTIEPPKPKYPQPENYCYYCTEGNCDECSLSTGLEEEGKIREIALRTNRQIEAEERKLTQQWEKELSQPKTPKNYFLKIKSINHQSSKTNKPNSSYEAGTDITQACAKNYQSNNPNNKKTLALSYRRATESTRA